MNNILKKNNNSLKNNRSKVYANTFRHTECHQEGAVLKKSNPTLICKQSKKLKRLDPCKGKMCWHRLSKSEKKKHGVHNGGGKVIRKINKFKKNSKKSRKNKKSKKNNKRPKNSNKK